MNGLADFLRRDPLSQDSTESLPPPYAADESDHRTFDPLPPPSIWHQKSPTNNADGEDAARARDWTSSNLLLQPRSFTSREAQRMGAGLVSLSKPEGLLGEIIKNSTSKGCWSVRTRPGCHDTCLLSDVPLHSGNNMGMAVSSPAPRFCYFELRVHRLDPEAGIAIGFTALPYPTWRLPGWERASLAVHSDDGRRYVNDSGGGRDFTRPFQPAESIGIGIRFVDPRPSAARGNISYHGVQVFLTRNGALEGTWDLHEETDSEMDQPGGVDGLEGDRDLYAAVGVFGAVACTVNFGKNNWGFKPENWKP